jgi:flavin-dependent thymidylate synthase
MPRLERVEDKWKHLREDLYCNAEPEVTLEAITIPVIKEFYSASRDVYNANCEAADDHEIDWRGIEQLPALTAATSYGSKEKIEGNYERAVALNKSLISKKHLTPFECVQYQFHIKGLSKAAGAQLSRYRHSGHISQSRRYQSAGIQFVYPVLDYIESEDHAKHILSKISYANNYSLDFYDALREGLNRGMDLVPEDGKLKTETLHKEDARRILPVSYATERSMWVNVRSLRHIFDERLRADTESELRRLVWMIWDLVEPLTPSFYFDIKEQFNEQNN